MVLTPSDELQRPVVVLAGLGIPAAISSAMEAYVSSSPTAG